MKLAVAAAISIAALSTAAAPQPRVYFTELGRPRVRRLDPARGAVRTVLGRD